MTTWQCLEMNTGVTMDAWHGFLDGGRNCKSFQSNGGFWCFFGGLDFFSQSNTCQAGSHWAFPWRRATLEVKIPWELCRIPLRRLRLRVCRATTRLWRIPTRTRRLWPSKRPNAAKCVAALISIQRTRDLSENLDGRNSLKSPQFSNLKWLCLPIFKSFGWVVAGWWHWVWEDHIPKLSGKTNFQFPNPSGKTIFTAVDFPNGLGRQILRCSATVRTNHQLSKSTG